MQPNGINDDTRGDEIDWSDCRELAANERQRE